MKVGDYVRTKDGLIRKIVEIDKLIYIDKDYISDEPEYHNSLIEEDVIKSSPNIIDLIEVGDYVNELPVEGYYTRYDEEKDDYIKIGIVTLEDYWKGTFTSVEDIKSIVTKEQFERMQYKVGE